MDVTHWLDKEVKITRRKLSIYFFITWFFSLWGLVDILKHIPIGESFQLIICLGIWIGLIFFFDKIFNYYNKVLEEKIKAHLRN